MVPVKCECELILEFSDESEAAKVLGSVKQDNDEWISARQEANMIICSASSKSIGGLMHTMDDFLSCIALAEKMIRN